MDRLFLFSKLIACLLCFFSCLNTFSTEESFLLIHGTSNKVVMQLGPHNNERISPCSTFKVVLSLIGYDAGVLKDEKNSVQMTKALLFMEELPEGWKLFGKTGMGLVIDQDGKTLEHGWFVGWIEKDYAFFPFAYTMRAKKIEPGYRITRVKQLLAESKVLKKE
ncbi:MAG: bla [Chlamydiia bacterium]|nr:bla [Chlamydiia bacterium]